MGTLIPEQPWTLVLSLMQVGAISPHGLEPLIQSIHDCLSSSDWATRKVVADALNALALHSSNLITGKMGPTITTLEDCRFDKNRQRNTIGSGYSQHDYQARPPTSCCLA